MHGQVAAATYRQISQKRKMFAGNMYTTICVEWAAHQFGLSLT